VKRLRHDLAAVYLRNCWHEVSLKPAFNFGSSAYARPTTLRGSYISDAVLGDVWNLSQLDAVWGKAQGRAATSGVWGGPSRVWGIFGKKM
jgi:hypothetical protein